MDGKTLTQEALQLNIVERVYLIDVLWRSLDSIDQEVTDRSWLDESQSRLNAYHAGQLLAIDGQEVLSRIEASLQP
jgi:putative addiction module component (TIGR02574 family)